MSLQTYRLEIRDTETGGIDVDVYGEDDLVEASTRVIYDEYGLESDGSTDSDAIVEEVTADVMTLDIQTERDGAGFSFRLLGDRDELASVRVDDEEWGLE